MIWACTAFCLHLGAVSLLYLHLYRLLLIHSWAVKQPRHPSATLSSSSWGFLGPERIHDPCSESWVFPETTYQDSTKVFVDTVYIIQIITKDLVFKLWRLILLSFFQTCLCSLIFYGAELDQINLIASKGKFVLDAVVSTKSCWWQPPTQREQKPADNN